MSIFYRTVTIDFTDADNDNRVAGWLKEHRLEADSLADLTFETKVEVDVKDMDEGDIIAAYDKLNKADDSDMYHIELAYRRMAEGDIADAMDILSRQFNLAPPCHEKSIADLLSRGRETAHG